MNEFIQDSPQPQFLSAEAVYFLRCRLQAFETSQSPDSHLGSTALAATIEPEWLDRVGTDPKLESAFVGKLYDGVLVCLENVNPVVRGKRHHSSKEQKLLQESELYSGLLTAGRLAGHTMPYLPLEQRQYARYCELLTEQVIQDLDQLEYRTIDEVIQHLRANAGKVMH